MRVARFRCPVQPHHSLSGVCNGTMPIPQASPGIVLRIRVSSFCSREKASKCRRCKILASILVSAPPVFALTRWTAVKYSATTGACTKCFGGPFNRTMRTVFHHPSRSAGSCPAGLLPEPPRSLRPRAVQVWPESRRTRWAIRRRGGRVSSSRCYSSSEVGLRRLAEEQALHICLNVELVPVQLF